MDRPLKFFIAASIGFFLFMLFLYLTSIKETGEPISLMNSHNQDGLFVKAEREALTTIDTLFKLYHDFPTHSFVKFTTKNKSGIMKEVWGTVTELERDHVTATILEKFNPANELPKSVDLSIDQIRDWLVEVENDFIRGGFTTQVMLINEMQQESSAELDSQLKLFLDPIEEYQ